MPNVQITEQPLWRHLRERGPVPADALLRMFGVTTPPIDVDAIAKRLGFQVEYGLVDDGQKLGSVDLRDPPGIIRIDPDMIRPRQRFTLAHELGHAMLHDQGEYYRDDYFRGSKLEVEANAFAAQLLMPRWMLGPYTEQSFKAAQLATIFGVSSQAMEYRLQQLLVIP